MKTIRIRAVTYMLAGILLLVNCAPAANLNSQYTSGERVELNLQKGPDEIKDTQEFIALPSLLAVLAPEVVSFAAGKVREFYKRESKKYVAVYGTTRVGDDFYDRNESRLAFRYGRVVLNRYVKDKGNREIPAATLVFRWVTNEEKTLFALVPEQVNIEKAKAKLKRGDDKLDLSIHVQLDGFWQKKNGEIKSKTLGDAAMTLRNIRLGSMYVSGQKDGQYLLIDENGNESNYNVQTGWMAPMPLSVDDKGQPLPKAAGNYHLTVTVTETDDYGERVQRFGTDLYDARDIFIELLESTLE